MMVGQRIAVYDQALWNECTVMNPKKENFVQRLLGIDHRLHRNQYGILCGDLPGFLIFKKFMIKYY